MKTVQIKIVSIIEQGCFGVLLINNIPICVTLWPTFDKNEYGDFGMVLNPGNTYHCHLDYYHKVGYVTYEIEVSGHDRVLFHIGNLEKNSLGCCLVGEEFGFMNGKPAILSSGRAFNEFMVAMNGINEFDLEVIL
jgi:hypothetical protein